MRHRTVTLWTVVVAVLVLFSAVYAGTGKRTGTAGALELLIPVGSRGTALGGTFTAGISGVEAMYWNPAGMANTDKAAEVLASRLQYIADVDINYVAVQAKMGKAGILGLSFKMLDFGDIPVTTEYAPDGTGEYYSPGYTTVGASYARAMTDRIFFGFTTKIINESIMNVSATGVAFDFGVQYRAASGVMLGVCLRNLGTSMAFDGTDLEQRVYIPGYVEDPIAAAEDLRIKSQPFEMPTTMDIGIAYAFKPMEGHSLTAMANFRNNHFGLDNYGGGVEYQLTMEKFVFSLRGAASVNHDPEENKFYFMTDDNIWGPSFGGGLYYQVGPHMNVAIDYAYQLVETYFDNTQWFTLTLGF